jgi:AraC family transcriptional regulator
MNWSGKVLLWEEYGLFLGAAGSAELHESPAIKICISLEENFGLRISENDNWKSYSAAIIPAGLSHAIEGRGNRMAMFLLAPEGSLGQVLIPCTSTDRITEIPRTKLAKLLSEISHFENPDIAGGAGDEIFHRVIAEIADGSLDAHLPAIDPRVAQSIEWIRAGRDSGILVKDIAAEVDLSESRFSHLFTENVRVPVRRYLLWLRLRDALHMMAAEGGSLTETAHSAGFADSSHLTRTFKTSLGIAPSALVKDSSLVSFLK